MFETCPSCSASLSPTARVCLQCGTVRMLAPPAEMQQATTTVEQPNFPTQPEAEIEEAPQAVSAPEETALDSKAAVLGDLGKDEQRILPEEKPYSSSVSISPAIATAAPGFDAPPERNASTRGGQRSNYLLYGGSAFVALAIVGAALAYYSSSRHPLEPLTEAELHPTATPEATTPPIADATPVPSPASPGISTPAPLADNQVPELPDASVSLPEIQTAYARSIQTMNAAWRAIPAATRSQLLPAQQAWIRNKTAGCRARATGIAGGNDVQEAVRLECEMSRDRERLPQLRQYVSAEFASRFQRKQARDASRSRSGPASSITAGDVSIVEGRDGQSHIRAGDIDLKD